MSPTMDVAVIETHIIGNTDDENPTYAFVRDLTAEPSGDGFVISYIRNDEDKGTYVTSMEKKGRELVGHQEDGAVLRVRLPVPDDAILMGASVSEPLEVVTAHIEQDGGYLAENAEAVVDAANEVLAVILRTGLGVYFRESGVWQLKRMDPRLTNGTTLQILAPDALEYWDDEDEPMSIYDLPYMVDGVRVDPSERELADRPAEDDEEEEVR